MVQFNCRNERATKLIPLHVYGNVYGRKCIAGKDTGLANLMLYGVVGYEPQDVKVCTFEYYDKLTNLWYTVKLHGVIKQISDNEYEFTHVSSRGREKDVVINFIFISEDKLTDANCHNF